MRALAFSALIASAVVFADGTARVCAQTQAPTRLRAGDAVRIEIKDEPTLSGEFVVGDDGQLLLPTIGAVAVADRPFNDVERDLRSAYGRELVKPVIRLTPLVRIAVLGEVRTPGLFLIDPTYTVGDVLARAGGLTPAANPRKVVIRRPSGTIVGAFHVDSPPMLTRLGSGDEIMVERRGWATEHLGILLGALGSVGVALVTSALIR